MLNMVNMDKQAVKVKLTTTVELTALQVDTQAYNGVEEPQMSRYEGTYT